MAEIAGRMGVPLLCLTLVAAAFFLAVGANKQSKVTLLLEDGLDVNVRGTSGRTALHLACDCGLLQVLSSRVVPLFHGLCRWWSYWYGAVQQWMSQTSEA